MKTQSGFLGMRQWAFEYPDNTLIAKDGEKVVGFVSYGTYRWEEERWRTTLRIIDALNWKSESSMK